MYIGTVSVEAQPKEEGRSMSNYSADVSSGSSYDCSTPPNLTARLRDLYGSTPLNVNNAIKGELTQPPIEADAVGSGNIERALNGSMPPKGNSNDDSESQTGSNGIGLPNNDAIKDLEGQIGPNGNGFDGLPNNNSVKDEKIQPPIEAAVDAVGFGNANTVADGFKREKVMKRLEF